MGENKQRGGARPGAGRKKTRFTELPTCTRDIATIVLASKPDEDKTKGWQGEVQMWKQILTHPNAFLRFAALRYLTDRRDGKPATKAAEVAKEEPTRPLDFGNLPMPSDQPGETGKPN